ncbi:MAG TPA: nucleotidyltransferase domain-containing protein [Pseudonocardiaceae bacterium]|nr:nucleotidyltransferase domain-containing protein [Pseudonocardiaceae bacterium]
MESSNDNEPGTVLLAGVVGSTAHGLAGPESDVDSMGVFAVPTMSLLGLDTPALSRVSVHPDVTMHEAGKAARLLLTANPTLTELLWLPEELYEQRTPLGNELVEIRSAFLSAARVRDAYLGYASQQLRKLRTAKHARHLKRLVDQGFALYATGALTVRLTDPASYLEFGERAIADPDSARRLLADAQARFDRTRSALPVEPDRGRVQDWLFRVRNAFWLSQP